MNARPAARTAAGPAARTTARSAGQMDAQPGAQTTARPTVQKQARWTARTAGRPAVRTAARTGRRPVSSARRCPPPRTNPADLSASLSRPPREPLRPPAWTVRAACGGCAAGNRSRDRGRRRAGVRCRLGPAPRRLDDPRRADSPATRRPAGPRPRRRPAGSRRGCGGAGWRWARGPAAPGRQDGRWECSGPGRSHRGIEASRSRHPTSRTGRYRRRGTGRARTCRVVAASDQPAEARSDAPCRTRNHRCESESAGRSR
jgi:hypothetical protein